MSDILDKCIDYLIMSIGQDEKRCNIVMLNCLFDINNSFPEIANESLTVAKCYWFDQSISSQELTAQRIKCWQYLDDHQHNLPSSSKAYNSIRATICVLTPEGEKEDIYMTLDFFLETLVDIIDNDSQVEQIIIKAITHSNDGF